MQINQTKFKRVLSRALAIIFVAMALMPCASQAAGLFSSGGEKYFPCRMTIGTEQATQSFKCGVGKAGVKVDKKEGDLATPAGEFYFREVFVRSDRVKLDRVKTGIPIKILTPTDVWVDDVNSPYYNKFVDLAKIKLPAQVSREPLWRDDHVYDIITVIGYNDAPAIPGKGSAIFMHVAHPHFAPTTGCVELKKDDLLKVLSYIGSQTKIKINVDGTVNIVDPINPTTDKTIAK